MFELSQMEPMLCRGCGLVISIQLLLECVLFFFLFLVSFGLCLENISWLCVLCTL
jgi:hypothetical protein